MKCINSKAVFLCDPSFCAFDQVSKHVCSGVEGSSGSHAREDERVKGIKGAGKPEKFIKRFLSWHRRTSVSDLLASANDPACPQEDSPRVRLVGTAVDGSVERLRTPEFKAPLERRRISPPFLPDIPRRTFKPATSEYPSYRPPFNRRMNPIRAFLLADLPFFLFVFS